MDKVICGLLDIGGSNIVISDAGRSLDGLNTTLKAVGTIIGGILILIAIIKTIMAMADENPSDKMKASMTFGVGILFISISGVLSFLGIESFSSSTTVATVGGRIARLIGNMCTWSGGALLITAILMFVFALAQEQAEGRANAVKMIATSIGLLGAGRLGTCLSNLIILRTTSGNTYMSWIASFVAICATYAGGGFAVIGGYHMVLALRNEDMKEKDTAVRLFMVAIALISFRAVLYMFFRTGVMTLRTSI